LSTIKATTLSNLAGSKTVPTDTVVDGSAKAWVNFNGTGTVAIRRAFNVSSITDNGTGDYTVNFTNAMSDASYAVAGSLDYRTCFMTGDDSTPRTTTTVRLKNSGFSGSSVVGPTDKEYVSVAIFS